jgi:hypothetical protein
MLYKTLQGLAQDIVELMMQPDYLALLRLVIAESTRFPHLGELFGKPYPPAPKRIAAIMDLFVRLELNLWKQQPKRT